MDQATRSQLPISVVIPAFNAESTLLATLKTVKTQSCQPLEIIVVDDGSTDRTPAIARGAGARVISQRNSGLAASRNTGIAAARGEWIALLDADDQWVSDKLSRQWEAVMLGSGAGFVATDVSVERDGLICVRSTLLAHRHYQLLAKTRLSPSVALLSGESFIRALVRANFFVPSSVLVNRELVLQGLYFDPHLPSDAEHLVPEDFEWYLRLFRHTTALVVETPLVIYHSSGGSMSSNRGRMRQGDLALGEIVLSDPGRYAQGADAAFGHMRPLRRSAAGVWYLRALDFERAVFFLRKSWREKPSIETSCYLGIAVLFNSPLGVRIAAVLRSLWRAGRGRVARKVPQEIP